LLLGIDKKRIQGDGRKGVRQRRGKRFTWARYHTCIGDVDEPLFGYGMASLTICDNLMRLLPTSIAHASMISMGLLQTRPRVVGRGLGVRELTAEDELRESDGGQGYALQCDGPGCAPPIRRATPRPHAGAEASFWTDQPPVGRIEQGNQVGIPD
jgi:hypothetical protein